MYKQLRAEPQQYGLLLQKSSTHISSKSKEAIKQNVQNIEKPENINNEIKEALRAEYKKYILSEIPNIIQSNFMLNEKTKFFNEFNDYISRNKLKCSHTFLYDIKTKEPLYNFVNSRWPHLLENIKTFNEFIAEALNKKHQDVTIS